MNIDVYSFPGRIGEQIAIEYAIAVMEVAKNGAVVQVRVADNSWIDCAPAWDWSKQDYRIRGLGYAPVFSVNDYVFKDMPISKYVKRRVHQIQEVENGRLILKGIGGDWTASQFRYATHAEIEAYKTENKPKIKKVALDIDDFPPVCWLRWHTSGNHLITGYVSDGIMVSEKEYNYRSLIGKAEYSSNRINWFPCYKEIPE